jgi:hypothetical protein
MTFVGRLLKQAAPAIVEEVQFVVDLRRGPFDQTHRGNEAARKAEVGDRKVLRRASGLRPVIRVSGYFHFSH